MKVIKISALWCSACIINNKIWKDIKKDFPDLEIEELDFDFDEDVKKYNVGDILPVVIFVDNNREIKRLIGEKKKDDIYRVIEELYNEKVS